MTKREVGAGEAQFSPGNGNEIDRDWIGGSPDVEIEMKGWEDSEETEDLMGLTTERTPRKRKKKADGTVYTYIAPSSRCTDRNSKGKGTKRANTVPRSTARSAHLQVLKGVARNTRENAHAENPQHANEDLQESELLNLAIVTLRDAIQCMSCGAKRGMMKNRGAHAQRRA